jgi:hypothetical protein
MNLQILKEIEQIFLPRFLSISIDDDLSTQYHFDLLVSQCKLSLDFEIENYLSCLSQLQSVIEKLQMDDNLYSLNAIDFLSDHVSQTQTQTQEERSTAITIERRMIRRTELYDGYLLHGEYLCDVGRHDQGLPLLLNGVQMIEKERNGEFHSHIHCLLSSELLQNSCPPVPSEETILSFRSST